ncbi:MULTISPECIES: winged helix-turn-helix domain-containing protein [unclassified Streptomyces]|uniref:GntR family transcriptional regulator n=1 Tax=unclassified Streptomyces TaxID=2593676 RepID=UPI000DC7DFF7|nr:MULTISPECIES: winged helix-turn-helix domain-containing protein [unclassified Streptomyces]AWZ06136.1 GntR family transcriptional regulator [Streptomyces sp. ICC4]AWZ15126.1 GntR family transcriptional regulator [Streptomyces sp. ICC1]
MPSPSRGGGQAAMPKYQRIAAALRHEMDRTALTPGARLPSERSLAARYQVNRQTIRAALQHLREDGLVVTGRRGTRTAFPEPAPRPPAAVPARVAAPAPAGPPAPAPAPAAGPAQNWLTLVTLAPALADQLGMRGGERTLVHHHRETGPGGQTRRHEVTYLCPRAVDGAPELARYRDRAAAGVRDEDLGALHRWLERAANGGRVAETITMTRTSFPQAPAPAGGLSVRRTLHDVSGRLLAVTDLAFPGWDRLTFDRSHPAIGFRVT